MKVKDVMTTRVVTVSPDATFKEIVEALLGAQVSGVPVVDDAGRLLGLVTEADLLPKEARRSQRTRGRVEMLAEALAGRAPRWIAKAEAVTARQLMTTDLVTVTADEDVRSAARRMLASGVKRLPVVEGDRLIGIVSRPDVLRVFARTDGEVASDIEAVVHRCLYVRPDHEIDVAVDAGLVTLKGEVMRESDIRVVGAIVGGVDGVISVENHLTFREKDPRRPQPARAEGYGITR